VLKLPDLNWWGFLPLGALLAVGFAGASLPPHAVQPQERSQNHSAPQRPQQNIDTRRPDERLADYTLWLERFTGALAFLSILEIVFLFKTDRIAGRAADNAEKQMQLASAQHRLSRRQLALARIQHTRTRQLAEDELRAYVSLKESRVQFNDADLPVHVVATISNFGKTPAREVVYWIGATFGTPDVPEAQFSRPPDISKYSRAILAPTGELIMTSKPFAWDQGVLDKWEAGTFVIYLWGEVTYKDWFKKDRATKLLYCATNKKGDGQGALSPMAYGNDAT
jgi:hypothetical protein